MFNREKVLAELYESKELADAIGKMEPAELRDDLRQEIFVVACQLAPSKLEDLYNRKMIRFYLVRVMINMIQSDRSTFYNTHRRTLIHKTGIGANGEITPSDLWMEPDWEDTKNAFYIPLALRQHAHDVEPCQLKDKVGEALESIDPYEAELIRLYAEMGYSCRPVAKATGIQERSVRLAVKRGKDKLKPLLRNAH